MSDIKSPHSFRRYLVKVRNIDGDIGDLYLREWPIQDGTLRLSNDQRDAKRFYRNEMKECIAGKHSVYAVRLVSKPRKAAKSR